MDESGLVFLSQEPLGSDNQQECSVEPRATARLHTPPHTGHLVQALLSIGAKSRKHHTIGTRGLAVLDRSAVGLGTLTSRQGLGFMGATLAVWSGGGLV